MKEVTDPALLGQLEGKEVTDERILSLLNMQTTRPDERTFYQKAAQGATKAVGEQLGPMAETAAQFLIPQNEAEAGALLGGLGAQGIVAKTGMTGLPAAATRIGGAMVGGEAGGQLGGQPTGTGATLGGIGGVGGEVAAPLAGWVARSAPGMKQYINKVRSAEIGNIIERRVPPLAGARDPYALDQMAKDFEEGKGPLMQYYNMLTESLERKLGGRRLNIPELVDAPTSQTTVPVTYSKLVDKPFPKEGIVHGTVRTKIVGEPTGLTDIEGKIVPPTSVSGTVRTSSPTGGPPRDPVFGFAPKEQVIETTKGTATASTVNSAAVYDPVYNPTGGVSIRQVMDELKKKGHYGFGGEKANPNTRTIVGEEPRMEYGALIKKTKEELAKIDPSLATEFEANRKMAASGFTFLSALNKSQAFLRYPKDVQLNIPWLQQYVNQHQSEIRSRIGKESFEELKQVLWRGGKMGTRDVPAIGGGGMEDVAGETLRGVGGSPRLVTAPLRAILPSLGAQYAGRPPYSPSGGVRSLMDLMTQRGMAPFLQESKK